MIDLRSIQAALAAAGLYKGAIDGIPGPKFAAARTAALASVKIDASAWPLSRQAIALEQWTMEQAGISVGEIDGFVGPQTRLALEKWQDHLRDVDPSKEAVAHLPSTFPRQADAEKLFGKPGENHALLDLPYPMRIAWDKGTEIHKITINAKCADSAGRALKRVNEIYGYERLRALGLDLFGGCFANRPMRGGSRLSMHAYAAAIDINPEANQLRWGSDQAAMAKSECAPFLDAFAAEGWISLGRERNFDWMHLQAARL